MRNVDARLGQSPPVNCPNHTSANDEDFHSRRTPSFYPNRNLTSKLDGRVSHLDFIPGAARLLRPGWGRGTEGRRIPRTLTLIQLQAQGKTGGCRTLRFAEGCAILKLRCAAASQPS